MRIETGALDADSMRGSPLFTNPAQVVRCCCASMQVSIGGAGIDPERIPSGNPNAFNLRLDRETEKLACAAGIVARAKASGRLTPTMWDVLVALIAMDQPWQRAAQMAGLDDDGAGAAAVHSRVFRARHRGLYAIREEMGEEWL